MYIYSLQDCVVALCCVVFAKVLFGLDIAKERGSYVEKVYHTHG